MIFINGLRVRVGNEFVNGAKIPSWKYTVNIGGQIWMTKNLDVDDGQGGVSIVTPFPAYNMGRFGTMYYYTPEAAIRIANSIPGWHLPTVQEYETLMSNVGGANIAGTKLKSTYGWKNDGNGTDDYGFCVLPCGWGTQHGGTNYEGKLCQMWTSDVYDSTHQYSFSVNSDVVGAWIDYQRPATNGFLLPVRLIHD